MIASLARPALARVARRPRSLLMLALWGLVALGLAVAARVQGVSHGADHVLAGAFGGLALPLFAYVFVGELVGHRSLAASTDAVVAFGASPVRAVAVTLGLGIVGCTLAGAILSAAVAVTAHGTADPSPAGDALNSAIAGGFGGAAYAAWFLLGTSLGRAGGGRTLLLLVDWLLGTGVGPAAAVVPRGYVRGLMGHDGPLGASGRACSVALLGLGALCVLIALQRVRAIRR